VSTPCLGEQLTALVDGALGHAERERAHAHLAGCAGCRAEVEQQRALKARLAGLAGTGPLPPPSLVGALQALAVPGEDHVGAAATPRPARRRHGPAG
jgi:anti-sigma factor RsiW